MKPVISTVILNWNRSDLLRKTLDSYVSTVDVPYELVIVDNGSTDDSPKIIREFCDGHPSARAVYLAENRGGEALNEELERCQAPIVHISENDIEYLPGWSKTVLDFFCVFPKLGQLSPFGPMPEDNEVWKEKPCVLRHAQGRILYAALKNLGTTCFLRRELLVQGIRVHNRPNPNAGSSPFVFPDDDRLSAEIKATGFLTAFSPHYLVHNLGHCNEEFEQREEYYRENYRAKPWLDEAGWEARRAEWRKQPKPVRRSWLFPEEKVSPEKTQASAECANPLLWSMFDGWTAEMEVIEFLHSLVRLLKPQLILETGTWHGIAAEAMGMALRENGCGSLISLEIDPESHAVATARIAAANLQEQATMVLGASLEYNVSGTIDMALFDSALELQGAEFRRFLPSLRPGAIVLFHDTNSAHRVVGESVWELVDAGLIDAIPLPTPRGVMICRVRERKDKKGRGQNKKSIWKRLFNR